MLTILTAILLGVTDLPVVEVDRDNFEIRQSARVVITSDVIKDEDGDGVIHIIGDNLTVDFTDAHLRGSPPGTGTGTGTDPDQYTGIGVRITGSNNTIRGGRFSGYKVAIYAHDADGLTIEDVDVSDNFRQRLKSTPQQEDSSDWLWPHNNDNREWMTNYGGGVSIEASNNVTLRRIRARDVQNGILLSRVNDSRIYDNDCSFLSGWGLAMWRSSRNTIARNAFDFCIRGYSHGVYNRGQDSAGILMFEQCSNNLIAANSATHGGDGFFGFAGREALGEVNPRDDFEWYERRGNNMNLLIDNDFSYAAAHGIEMTFSFDNVFARNRLAGNAICGIWAGFSQSTLITLNRIEDNGGMPYGAERGGVNIEHGHANRIQENWFRNNPVGVRFWSRENHPLAEKPWGKANHKGSSENMILFNDFHQDLVVAELRRTSATIFGRNVMAHVAEILVGDEESVGDLRRGPRDERVDRTQWDGLVIPGETTPVGARDHLRGREHIIMTEWGPYDWSSPRLHRFERHPDRHAYRVLGNVETSAAILAADHARLERDEESRSLIVQTHAQNRVVPYRLVVETDAGELISEGVLVPAMWTIVAFPWKTDPREDVEQWRREGTILGEGAGVRFESPHLRFNFGHGGPGQAPGVPAFVGSAELPVDRFGTIANARITFPAGVWRIRTVSDDGIRVWLGEEKVIDDWTWHPPKEHVYEFAVEEEREIAIRVEHFELDGYAVLTLEIERAR